MQGKERNQKKIDAAFADRGWAAMQSMLDQEMPVNQEPSPAGRRNNYFLLFLFLLFGFIAGVATMMYYDTQQAPAKQEKTAPADEIAAVENSPQSDKISEPSASSAFGGGGQFASIDSNVGNYSSGPKNSTGLQPGKKEAGMIPLTSGFHPRSIDIVDENTANTTDYSADPWQKRGNITFAGHSSDKVEESPVLDPLAFQAEIEVGLIELIPMKWYPKEKIRFGLRVANLTREFTDFSGVSVGAVLNIPLEQNFALETGIQYSMLGGFEKGLDLSEINYSPFVSRQVENRINLNQVSTIQSQGANKALPIEKLHYIDLPLLLSYQPIGGVKIHMGLKASYLVFSEANFAEEEFAGNGGFDPSPEFRTDRDQALYESMKKVDFSTVLGFGYYPRKNLGLDLRYHHGLIDNTIDEVWKARQITSNKAFELSLIYLFNR